MARRAPCPVAVEVRRLVPRCQRRLESSWSSLGAKKLAGPYAVRFLPQFEQGSKKIH